nr:D-alanine--D-alanine ligase family protein [Actinoplanes solisilvae]
MQRAATRNRRPKVAVIFGGRSSEHDVSRRSADSVLRFLDADRYDVVPVTITRDGTWELGDTAPHSLPGMLAALEFLRTVDVAFPCLHGPFGEDGTVQGLLECAGVPYVGSKVLASATAMDKEFTKKIVAAEGIAVADSVVLREGQSGVSPKDRVRLGLPVFVKPARGGSSVGVSRVDDWDALPAAIAEARRWDSKVLVEAAVDGIEVDIALLQEPGGRVIAGPPLEVSVGAASDFFDYDAKYRAGGAEFVIPARLDPVDAGEVVRTARRVFEVLGCAGLLRVDFFLTSVGGRMVPVLNEVNTMPGLTELSQFPRIWQAVGMPYADLLDRLVDTALA